MKALFLRLLEFDAHHRVAVGFAAAVIAFVTAIQWVRPVIALIIAWDAFALSTLVLAWSAILYSDAKTRVQEATLQDSSRTALVICVILAALAGLLSAGLLLGAAKTLSGTFAALHVGLAAWTVISSWLLVHTVLTLHYAHRCYQLAEQSKTTPPDLGVMFPDEPAPDFLDFAYFSFIIGMTCQVSDVQITARSIRRIALMHGLLSFAFNTVIVALSLNLASTLL